MAWYVVGPERASPTRRSFWSRPLSSPVLRVGLAPPILLTVGIGKGAENGILIRSGDALQSSEKLDANILDRRGRSRAARARC